MNLKEAIKAYAWFVGFVVVTGLVVRPLVQKANVPLLKDVL